MCRTQRLQSTALQAPATAREAPGAWSRRPPGPLPQSPDIMLELASRSLCCGQAYHVRQQLASLAGRTALCRCWPYSQAPGDDLRSPDIHTSYRVPPSSLLSIRSFVRRGMDLVVVYPRRRAPSPGAWPPDDTAAASGRPEDSPCLEWRWQCASQRSYCRVCGPSSAAAHALRRLRLTAGRFEARFARYLPARLGHGPRPTRGARSVGWRGTGS